MNPTTPFSELIARRTAPDQAVVRFDISDDWLQGRTTFGGLIAACAVQAMRDVAGSAWDGHVALLALQTSFVGPVGLGTMDVSVQVLREGRNLRQLQATATQQGQTAAVLLAVFGVQRTTALPPLEPAQPEVERRAADLPALPFLPGVTPNFTQHLDFRWAEGQPPFTGGDFWHSRIHVRLKDPQPAAHELLAVMLADAAPTPALTRLAQRGPASSVTWALELAVPDATDDDCSGFWRIDKDTRAAAGGYVNETTRLWTPGGRLAAHGYQVVAVYG
ncbi:thioesterase family protein [Schlegelella sp. S2-27]|uniref:Thioesterase family protein n=1 Tax=Caldimonas mangrovi TaxID=2944811 RepID=A0ABT0YHC3_9BURK|nr:thioesterase family protein [Caldimonas mangrovi]MCM5678100.1 thioesterase family protein [Caldimonas mangrovi]